MATAAGKTSRLSYVADFIHEVQRNPAPPEDATGPWFARAEGGLFLSREQAATYENVLDRLVREHGKGEAASFIAIHDWVVDALFEAVDFSGSDRVSEERLSDAMARLDQRLTRSMDHYTCYLPVHGLANEGLPRVFGKVRFVVMKGRLLRKLAEESGLPLDRGIIVHRRQSSVVAPPEERSSRSAPSKASSRARRLASRRRQASRSRAMRAAPTGRLRAICSGCRGSAGSMRRSIRCPSLL
jgi:hypothetical protein